MAVWKGYVVVLCVLLWVSCVHCSCLVCIVVVVLWVLL